MAKAVGFAFVILAAMCALALAKESAETTLGSVQCRSENVHLCTQEDVLKFGGLECELVLNLHIGSSLCPGDTVSTDISTLKPLQSISFVEHLFVSRNGELSGLDGLAITSVNGDLQIKHNAKLAALPGLEHVTEVFGNVFIHHNDGLKTTSGLASLLKIGGELRIRKNPQLMDLGQSFRQCTIGGSIEILGNDNLREFGGFEGLTEVAGDLQISNDVNTKKFTITQAGIEEANGEYTKVTENFMTDGGIALWEKPAKDWAIVYYRFENTWGPAWYIQRIKGGAGASAYIQKMSEEYDKMFDNGLPPLTGWEVYTGAYCYPGGGKLPLPNVQLEGAGAGQSVSFAAFANIVKIQGNLEITNTGVTVLKGFDNVVTIGGDLKIEENDALTSLEGLGSLQEASSVSIQNNIQLESLEGLQKSVRISKRPKEDRKWVDWGAVIKSNSGSDLPCDWWNLVECSTESTASGSMNVVAFLLRAVLVASICLNVFFIFHFSTKSSSSSSARDVLDSGRTELADVRQAGYNY